jgi:predicted nucleotidyltransferase
LLNLKGYDIFRADRFLRTTDQISDKIYKIHPETAMNTIEKIRQMRAEIMEIAHRHGAARVRIFGSVARGEETVESDVDFLVEAGPNVSSWFPAGLIIDLENLLGRRVEIVTEKGLSPLLRDRVVAEAVPL